MTQEKFKQVLKINESLEELKKFRDEIDKNSKDVKLLYTRYRNNGDYTRVSRWPQHIVSDILLRHDYEIRKEIDQEIDRLNKEIESL